MVSEIAMAISMRFLGEIKLGRNKLMIFSALSVRWADGAQKSSFVLETRTGTGYYTSSDLLFQNKLSKPTSLIPIPDSKCHFSTVELSPCDCNHLVTSICICLDPEVVTLFNICYNDAFTDSMADIYKQRLQALQDLQARKKAYFSLGKLNMREA